VVFINLTMLSISINSSLEVSYNSSFIERLDFSVVVMARVVVASFMESLQVTFRDGQNNLEQKPVYVFSARRSSERALVVVESWRSFQASFLVNLSVEEFVHISSVNMSQVVNSQLFNKRVTLSSYFEDNSNNS
jgi:hypothetical protein